jgi:hypothetical protein
MDGRCSFFFVHPFRDKFQPDFSLQLCISLLGEF